MWERQNQLNSGEGAIEKKSGILYYEDKGRKFEFVPNFTYLGVIMQTKGGHSGHIQNLKHKDTSACT